MSTIVIGEQAEIPTWVVDQESFRRWARSRDFPQHGSYSHLNGDLWVDIGMESIAHNLIKTQIAAVLTVLSQSKDLGKFLGDRMMLSHLYALLSTEPDGIFIANGSLDAGRVTLLEGDESLEVIGAPDMVLEVISKTSVRKDTVVLPELYFRAGIPEYWLVDSRPGQFRFDIFRRGRRKYVAAPKSMGWIKSEVFGKSFKLTHAESAGATTEYRLRTR